MEFREAPAGELVDVDHSGDGGYDYVPDEGCLVISVAIGDGEDGEEEGGEYAEEKAEAEGVQGVGFEGGWEAGHGCAVLFWGASFVDGGQEWDERSRGRRKKQKRQKTQV